MKQEAHTTHLKLEWNREIFHGKKWLRCGYKNGKFPNIFPKLIFLGKNLTLFEITHNLNKSSREFSIFSRFEVTRICISGILFLKVYPFICYNQNCAWLAKIGFARFSTRIGLNKTNLKFLHYLFFTC